MQTARSPSVKTQVRRFIKRLLPQPVIKMYVDYVTEKNRSAQEGRFQGLSTKEVFTKIYTEGHWGEAAAQGQTFYSGSGSHDSKIVSTYTQAVAQFLKGLPHKPDVVDLGCGDFSVGSKLRALCANYVACDIVEPLIAFNKNKFADLNVDFRVVDLTQDEPPAGQVAFLRQVLQHLSNPQIAAIVPKIQSSYEYLVLTEHIPNKPDFEHNLDKPVGPDMRLNLKGKSSGVVLTSPPFNLVVTEARVLCETFEFGSVIRTTAYRLR